MGLLSSKISRDELKPGDHIYSWRDYYIYAHHGIYVGEGKVIHFTLGQESATGTSSSLVISCSSSSSAIGNLCPDCGYQSGIDGGVISSCIKCFLRGGDLFLFEYEVSIRSFLSQIRGGTCTLARSDPPEVVLYRARYLLKDKKSFGNYDLFRRNCEDFAIYCKTGLIVINATLNRAGRLVISSVTTSFIDFGGVALMPVIERLSSDISMRNDAEKISVEILVSRNLSK